MNRLPYTRRRFLKNLGIGGAAIPFLSGLPSLQAQSSNTPRAKRLVVMFSPNGTLPGEFWPDHYGDEVALQLKPILEPLEAFKDQMLLLKGVDNKMKGDGDSHMRGMSCVLTAALLNPGNIQGGGNTPAGWASGRSIDQQVRNYFQSQDHSRTRFGSLEFGVAVPNRADPWTRMCYAGDNKPLAPIDDPGQMFKKLYGGAKDRADVASVLDFVKADLDRISRKLSSEDRDMLAEHMELVRQLEGDIAEAEKQSELVHPEPEIDPNIELINDNTPEISRMQMDLLVNALANDMTRVASIQYMRSVGQARMRWLGIEEGHHSLSHEKDDNRDAYEKLLKINVWFANELRYLAQRLRDTPEPGRPGESLLDNTQIVWVNELGKGNSHTLKDVPFVLIGGGCNFKTGRALEYDSVPHNRLWLALAHGMGETNLKVFGSEDHCADGPLALG